MSELVQIWVSNSAASWLVLTVLLLLVEIVTLGLTTIWFAGGSLGGFLVALANGPLWLQFVVFVVISLVLLFFTRPIAVRFYNSHRIKTNAESLIGQSAILTEDIDNLSGKGKAVINGMEWTARSAYDEEKLKEGTTVTVKRIQGVKLIVEEKI